MTPRRLYAPVVLATLAAGGLAFFAAGRTWAQAQVKADGMAAAAVKVTGSDAQPLVSALALVVVTAALAVLAAGPRLRRVVGGFTMLVAVGGVVAIPFTGGSRLADAVTKAAQASPAYTGPASLHSVSHYRWDLVTVAAFAVAVVLGFVTLRLGPAWPTMGSRYDAPTRRAATPTRSDTDLWKAMDDGHDPTA